MQQMTLASCANCWFNGLQYGSIGLSVGYCSEHLVVLRRPDETTCGRHTRKDLLLWSARAFRDHHQHYFSSNFISSLGTREEVKTQDFLEPDTSFVRQDRVGDVVADYGEYETKIESLAQLRTLRAFRAEFAMLSLGRAYTDRCILRGGRWTSGIHLLWWAKRRMKEGELFEPKPSDFRYPTAGSLQRQVELGEWSLLMFRLTFISDLGTHSRDDDESIQELEDIAEAAAIDTEIPSKRKLLTWIKKKGSPLLERVLPETRYREITENLRR